MNTHFPLIWMHCEMSAHSVGYFTKNGPSFNAIRHGQAKVCSLFKSCFLARTHKLAFFFFTSCSSFAGFLQVLDTVHICVM